MQRSFGIRVVLAAVTGKAFAHPAAVEGLLKFLTCNAAMPNRPAVEACREWASKELRRQLPSLETVVYDEESLPYEFGIQEQWDDLDSEQQVKLIEAWLTKMAMSRGLAMTVTDQPGGWHYGVAESDV